MTKTQRAGRSTKSKISSAFQTSSTTRRESTSPSSAKQSVPPTASGSILTHKQMDTIMAVVREHQDTKIAPAETLLGELRGASDHHKGRLAVLESRVAAIEEKLNETAVALLQR